MQKINKVVRVNFSGGLIGLFAGRSKGKIQQVIQDQNAEGWNYVDFVPDQPNLIIYFLRAVLLTLTLGLWTIATGYIFVFEKPRYQSLQAQKMHQCILFVDFTMSECA